MGGNIRQDMKARYELLLRTIWELKNRIEQFPEGIIHVRHQNGRIYYYRVISGKAEAIMKNDNRELIKSLVQKEYLLKALRSAVNESEALKRMMKIYPESGMEEVYDNLPKGRRMLAKPIVPGDEQVAEKWMNVSYERKPFKKGAPVFKTIRGERVRSKSEAIIADRLWANGIPYRYECPLKIGKKVIHPDFTVLRMSDRKIVYHEHCGKMDDPEYTEDLLGRINDYNHEKIFFGDRLFLSFESSKTPLDIEYIENLINTHFR